MKYYTSSISAIVCCIGILFTATVSSECYSGVHLASAEAGKVDCEAGRCMVQRITAIGKILFGCADHNMCEQHNVFCCNTNLCNTEDLLESNSVSSPNTAKPLTSRLNRKPKNKGNGSKVMIPKHTILSVLLVLVLYIIF